MRRLVTRCWRWSRNTMKSGALCTTNAMTLYTISQTFGSLLYVSLDLNDHHQNLLYTKSLNPRTFFVKACCGWKSITWCIGELIWYSLIKKMVMSSSPWIRVTSVCYVVRMQFLSHPVLCDLLTDEDQKVCDPANDLIFFLWLHIWNVRSTFT